MPKGREKIEWKRITPRRQVRLDAALQYFESDEAKKMSEENAISYIVEHYDVPEYIIRNAIEERKPRPSMFDYMMGNVPKNEE